MAYDSVRAQLDKLLGPDRNGPLATTATDSTDYRHPQVCKYYLLGFCPADLHIKHRSEPGSCKHRHSDTAKAAFQRDLASHNAARDNARWTSSLLSECRTIVADEDRRVRCHARRLKETYNVQGDLNGLMIQSFDTLKKLGMVRKNAKIRVLSEADDDHSNADLVSKDAVDEENQPFSEKTTSVEEPNKLPLPSDETHPITSSRERNELDNKHERSDSVPSPSKKDDCTTVVDNGDDDDDFGLIKVIPAVNKTENNLSGTKDRDVSAGDESEQMRGAKVVTPVVEEKPLESESTREGSPAKSSVKHDNASLKDSGTPGDEDVANAKLGPSSDDKISSPHDSGRTPPDGQKTQEGQHDGTITANSMDYFYERGMGPDGLLMLDKKQSLRVCSCCGGYISLVDAESRLLSHYGGKSHHSMAQLRQKLQQLEAQSAETRSWKMYPSLHTGSHPQERFHAKPNLSSDGRPSSFRYTKSPERHGNRYGARSSDRFDDRRRPRYRKDSRGFGTSDWYNSYLPESGDGYSSQRSDAHRNPEVNNNRPHQERWFGRKRHRSRSPIRDFRRSRRR